MKRLLLIVVSVALVAITNFSCCKSGGGGGGNTEPALAVTITPANGSTQPAAPGPTFPLKIVVTANMPTAGDKIDVKAAPDGTSN